MLVETSGIYPNLKYIYRGTEAEILAATPAATQIVEAYTTDTTPRRKYDWMGTQWRLDSSTAGDPGSPSAPFTTVSERTAWATANLATLLPGRTTAWGPGNVEYRFVGPTAGPEGWEELVGRSPITKRLRVISASHATFTALGDSLLAYEVSFGTLIERTLGWKCVYKDGVSGSKIDDMISRSPGTVFSVDADFCIIEALTNNLNFISADAAAEKMRLLCQMARRRGQEPIIIPVGPVDRTAYPQRYFNGLLINFAVAEMALANDVTVFPIWESCKGVQSWLANYQISGDAGLYHPNYLGHYEGAVNFALFAKGAMQPLNVSTFTSSAKDLNHCFGPINGLGANNGTDINNWFYFGMTGAVKSIVTTERGNVAGLRFTGISTGGSVNFPIGDVALGDVVEFECDVDFGGYTDVQATKLSIGVSVDNGGTYNSSMLRVPPIGKQTIKTAITITANGVGLSNAIYINIPTGTGSAFFQVSRPVFRNLTKITVARQSIPAGMA